MRKWMSERFKRRKKAAEKPTTDGPPASAPLQPKYFEAETSVPADTATREPEPSPEPTEPAEQPEASEAAPGPSASRSAPRAAASDDPARRSRRRRRGRGGRGRDKAQPTAT